MHSAGFFFSGATECELDKQGRANIPGTLVDHAKLDKDCVVIGVSNRVEIWSKQIWESYFQESEQSFNEIAEKLVDFNFFNRIKFRRLLEDLTSCFIILRFCLNNLLTP